MVEHEPNKAQVLISIPGDMEDSYFKSVIIHHRPYDLQMLFFLKETRPYAHGGIT